MTTAQVVETSVTVTNSSSFSTLTRTITLDKRSKMYNYEVIANYWVVYKQKDNVLLFFPVNSEIIVWLYVFFFLCACATNKSTVTFLQHFFRDARASVRTGSYAPDMYLCNLLSKDLWFL